MKPVTRYLDQSSEESESAKVAVVLLHVGGAESDADVEPFYRRLWSNPEVMPRASRGFLAGLSNALGGSRRRQDGEEPPEVATSWDERGGDLQQGHRLIGGRSPLLELVRSQALALENRLNRRPVMAPSVGGTFRVFHGYRYAEPSIEDAVAEAAKSGASEIVGIPMYVQRSVSLTGPCMEAFSSAAARHPNLRAMMADPIHEHPRLLNSITDRVRRSIDLIPTEHRDEAFLVLSAHSPPYDRAQADDYLAQVESTAQKVMSAVGYDEERSALAWTSFRAGTRHLTPSVSDFCEERGKAGRKAVVVAPITYLTDGFETLHDLDIEAYQAALGAGVIQYRRATTLNADPAFIDLLAGLVLAQVPDVARVWAREGEPIRGATAGGSSA